MLKAKTIQAVSIDLADNVEAVFVAQGEPWNGLQEWRCIAPGAFAGDRISPPRPSAMRAPWRACSPKSSGA